MEIFKKLDELVDQNYLRKVISPCKKLVLYNYTEKCTYDKHWNEYTLNARGTVYEIETGKVIANAFPKFFNYGEHTEEKQTEILKAKNFKVYDKLDGSLGIIYFYDGSWRVNTRGSFTSDQAVKGKEMLSKYQLNNMPKNMNFLVEIIYPENRIILDYGDKEKLVLLGCYQDGLDLDAELKDIAYHLDMDIAKCYNYNCLSELVELRKNLPATTEGFVVGLENGERLKFKGEEYLKIARILSGCSPLTFWESMKNGRVSYDLLKSIPEEFRPEFDKIAYSLESKYFEKQLEIGAEYSKVMVDLGFHRAETNEEKKKLGLYLKEVKNLEHSSVMFSYFLTNHDAIDKYIMKQIRPKSNII